MEQRMMPTPPPATGCRMVVVYATDGATASSYCEHGTALMGPATRELIDQYVVIGPDGCPVVEWVMSWAPARLVSSVPDNPLAGSVEAFLMQNPPEECGCDPDVSVTLRAPFPAKSSMVRLEHEDDCPGRLVKARGIGSPSGGRA